MLTFRLINCAYLRHIPAGRWSQSLTQTNDSLIYQVFHAFRKLWIRACEKKSDRIWCRESGGGEKIDGCSIQHNLTVRIENKATKAQIIRDVLFHCRLCESEIVSSIPEAFWIKLCVGAHERWLTLLQGESHPHYMTELYGGSHRPGLISITMRSLQPLSINLNLRWVHILYNKKPTMVPASRDKKAASEVWLKRFLLCGFRVAFLTSGQGQQANSGSSVPAG